MDTPATDNMIVIRIRCIRLRIEEFFPGRGYEFLENHWEIGYRFNYELDLKLASGNFENI